MTGAYGEHVDTTRHTPVTTASSVIVVSYKPGDWLLPCLDSVTDQADEVIVIDNGSADAEASRIARAAGARVIRSSRNLGFTRGFNTGLKAAGGDVIGLLNDDAIAGPTWLSAATDVFQDHSVVAVSPKVLLRGRYAEIVVPPDPHGISDTGALHVSAVTAGGRDVSSQLVGAALREIHYGEVDNAKPAQHSVLPGKAFYVPVDDDIDHVLLNGVMVETGRVTRVVNHAGSFLRAHGIAGEYGFGAPDDGRFDTRAERFGFSGTAPVFTAEGLRLLGGFAGPFFAYNEDTDWCLRARLAGFRVMYDPTATVEHRSSATSGGVHSAFVRFLAERNALLCLLRNAPWPVIRRYAVPRLRRGPRDEVRTDVLRKAPWALTSRISMMRRRVLSSHDVWERWADRDTSWDDSPLELG
jgi:GT2 family glycosyltransferase